ncbi:MAG: lipocalin family protein [Bacteroidota bacterium]
MKNKYTLLFLSGLLAVAMLANSCKKDTQGTVDALLARGTWQLASVLVYNYVGGTNTSTDTLNTKCSLNQTFTFNADNTCTYKDFACITQTVNGQWQLVNDKLTLQSTLSCKDTLAGANVTSTPFKNARIVNLGQFSMILETGDLSSYYLSTDKRHIKRYGFIRY